MTLQVNKNKRIGRVIFFVEGDVDEPKLLRAIFCDVLGYHVVVRDKRNGAITEYGKDDDKYSKIFVVPMPTPSICNLPGSSYFMNSVYNAMSNYGLARDEASIYYLFDRDYQSNTPEAVKREVSLLKNPLDNGTEMPGALLISYPCLQAYYCEAHADPSTFRESHDAKKHVNAHGLKRIDEESVKTAAASMLSSLKTIRGVEFDVNELSDYSKINFKVFEFEEKARTSGDLKFLTLCLLSLALLDLGVVEIKE